jgi:2-keto-3-deoxy-L-rhamnonate aldolase RhmA
LKKAFGVRLVTNTSVIQLASNSGFDAIFVDLEHSTLSIDDASALSTAALNVGLTPLVRVPHQCGNGFVQRILDGGAMGVVFPHIHTRGAQTLFPLMTVFTLYSSGNQTFKAVIVDIIYD